MNMQDKDLDQLFRSTLDDLELEPSAGIWANIRVELDGAERRKSIIPLLRIAAVMLVILSAGLFFLPIKQAVIDTPKNKLAVNQVVKLPSSVLSNSLSRKKNVIAHMPHLKSSQSYQATASIQHSTVKTSLKPIVPLTTNFKKRTDALYNSKQVMDETRTDNLIIANKPTVPDINIPLVNKTPPIVAGATSESATILATAPDTEANLSPVKSHKIHGLGSFINAVVGVVDKRPDKIIEFTDTDEGNTVTGLNLGIVSIKKNQ